jgi:hypothetical protein
VNANNEPWFVVQGMDGHMWMVVSTGTAVHPVHMQICGCARKEDAYWICSMLIKQARSGLPPDS